MLNRWKTSLMALLCLCAGAAAYLPGESDFVSLENSHGIWGNPAGMAAFDSKGALTSYDYDDGISRFRLGGNLENWGAGFDYVQGPEHLDESRWSLTHASAFFSRSFFWGSRITAFRSSDFEGTEWSYSQGFMLRPWRMLSLGFSTDNLLYVGPKASDRIVNMGATLRLGNSFSVSYDWEKFENHRLLLELEAYGIRWGAKFPLFGDDDEFMFTFSTAIGGYTNAAVHVYDDLLPKGGAFGYHSSRNPRASIASKIIRIPLDMEVSEVDEGFSLFGSNSMSIWKVRNLFEHIYKDPSCGLVVLDFSGYRGGLGVSNEINRSVEKLKKLGGKVIAYMDDVRPSVLLAASKADRIVMEPSAHLNWQGMGGSILYYKGLFDKLGVKVEFLRHGKYKSAVEPYIADSMSVEARENREALYKDLWSTLSALVGHRKMNATSSSEKIVAYLDSIAKVPMVTSTGAMKAGLVDTTLYLDQVASYAIKTFFNIDAPYAQLRTWRPMDKKIFDESWAHRSKIAVLNIDGSIDSRMERSVLQSLRELRYSGAKALIVRISSPGGSAIASDKIWAALRHVSEVDEIPVVASIGTIGASGGYYIACGADRIIADPLAIVGSIGIYGGKVDASGLLSKIGVRSETIKTHDYADSRSYTRPWTNEEMAALQEYMDDFYNRFTGVVSKATGIPQETVDSAYGGGRVMMAMPAFKAGLVHKIGGLDDAIDMAKELAGISKDDEVRLYMLDTEKSYNVPAFSVKFLEASASGKDRAAKFLMEDLPEYIYDLEKVQLWAIEPSLWGME